MIEQSPASLVVMPFTAFVKDVYDFNLDSIWKWAIDTSDIEASEDEINEALALCPEVDREKAALIVTDLKERNYANAWRSDYFDAACALLTEKIEKDFESLKTLFNPYDEIESTGTVSISVKPWSDEIHFCTSGNKLESYIANAMNRCSSRDFKTVEEFLECFGVDRATAISDHISWIQFLGSPWAERGCNLFEVDVAKSLQWDTEDFGCSSYSHIELIECLLDGK